MNLMSDTQNSKSQQKRLAVFGFLILISSSIFITSSTFADAGKQKVLVLGIQEENWDDIKISIGVQDAFEVPTKAQFLRENAELYDKRMFNSPSFQLNTKACAQAISTGTIAIAIQNVFYLGNTDTLADADLIDWGTGRFGVWSQVHSIGEIPTSLHLNRTLSRNYSWTRSQLRKFRWMRDVGSLSISNIQMDGQITVRYGDQTAVIPVGSSQVLQDKKRMLPPSQFEFDDVDNGIEQEQGETVGDKTKSHAPDENIALTKEWPRGKPLPTSFYLRSRVTVFNLGYKEF